MKIRTLNTAGIDEFRSQLVELKTGARKELNVDFLTDNTYSQEFEPEVEIEFSSFKNKQEIAEYLTDKLNLVDNKQLYYNIGLWTWLTVFYFELVCPKNSQGLRKINEEAKYILTEPKNWRRYYRHLLACAARQYCELDILAKPFLAAQIHIWGDFHEQLTAYQEIATNKPLIQAANDLYWDAENAKLKRGAGSKGAGTPRRFSDIVGQFELTYDLNAMPSDDILGLFPDTEFSKWVTAA